MTKITTLSGAAAILMLTAGASFAAPCAVGTTTNNQGASSSADKSSLADGTSTAKTTPGVKAETPGTVGALNNVGAGTKPADGEQKPAEGKVVKPGSNDC
ncbi:hypothetical protein FV222_09550 [Methylobacterium sp. WL103]|uniref:hypothetical protein n=1 Tax=Methylobacterium sp. WL103 TaxID=2603891 RepID=UPI0011C7176F|nr:hypothetical protein [Methylobacterium sp. WL103]TXN02427.1 hypothetical protein FV222_09550 [Methylobacterium sp. WL103]